MAKGKNTTVIAVRVQDGVYTLIKRDAEQKGMTVNEWLKRTIRERLRNT